MLKKKLLYFHAGKSSFVTKDIEILNEEFEVIDFFFDTMERKNYYKVFFKQIYFILTNIIQSKIIVCQFAGHHSFFPILSSIIFRKNQ